MSQVTSAWPQGQGLARVRSRLRSCMTCGHAQRAATTRLKGSSESEALEDAGSHYAYTHRDFVFLVLVKPSSL